MLVGWYLCVWCSSISFESGFAFEGDVSVSDVSTGIT